MMNKTILMLSVSCMSFIAGADLCYAGFNPYDTPPALSAVMLNSRNSTHTSHLTAAHLSSLEDFAELTLPENSDLFLPKDLGSYLSYPLPKDLGSSLSYPLPKDLGRGWGGFHNTPLIQLAAACFVTDTTDCSGNEFAGNNADDDNGGVPPGGDDYELDDSKRCEEEGYLLTSCPEDSDPINFCPYDSTYFEKCKANCPSNYVTCEPPYHGVGEACGDKYASCECTPCSSGYDYTTIPEGYVQDGEACLDCDGKTKYKIKPNPCDGFMDCGSMGPEAGANTCQSGTEIKYDNCKPCPNECSMDSCPSPYTCKKEECSNKYCKNGCQSGYVWNASSQTCTCDSSYKYTCDGPDQKGSGQSCDGKYKSCACNNNKTWNGSECLCDTSIYRLDCSGENMTGSSSCNGKYDYCYCYRPYELENNQCVCPSSYKYTCTGNGESTPTYGDCNNKYEKCICTKPKVWSNSQGKCICDPDEDWYNCSKPGSRPYGSYTSCDGLVNRMCFCSVGYVSEKLDKDTPCKPMNKCAEGSENGYILYSDKTRSKDLISGKTPIGIVICSYPEGGGQAISLTPVYSGPWGASNDIPNIANKNNKEDAVLDIASCANTKAITAAGNESLYPAAWAIQKYSTAGTSPGEWCMPAAGVVAHMTSLFANADETWDNMRNPNKTLQLVGSSAQFDDMQSSTETTHAGSVWRSMDNVAHGGIGLTSSTMAGKNLNSDFWAVIEF